MIGQKPSTPYRPDLTRRGQDAPATNAGWSQPAAAPAPEASDNGRRLIVGHGISLTGEISACDHLDVEGRIEVKLKDCLTINVTEGGVFKGSAEIGDADIAGKFDGELTVRGRLKVRATGVVSGAVRYEELEVEAGGKIMGTIEPLTGRNRNATATAAREEPEVPAAAVVTAMPGAKARNGAREVHAGE